MGHLRLLALARKLTLDLLDLNTRHHHTLIGDIAAADPFGAAGSIITHHIVGLEVGMRLLLVVHDVFLGRRCLLVLASLPSPKLFLALRFERTGPDQLLAGPNASQILIEREVQPQRQYRKIWDCRVSKFSLNQKKRSQF